MDTTEKWKHMEYESSVKKVKSSDEIFSVRDDSPEQLYTICLKGSVTNGVILRLMKSGDIYYADIRQKVFDELDGPAVTLNKMELQYILENLEQINDGYLHYELESRWTKIVTRDGNIIITQKCSGVSAVTSFPFTELSSEFLIIVLKLLKIQNYSLQPEKVVEYLYLLKITNTPIGYFHNMMRLCGEKMTVSQKTKAYYFRGYIPDETGKKVKPSWEENYIRFFQKLFNQNLAIDINTRNKTWFKISYEKCVIDDEELYLTMDYFLK